MTATHRLWLPFSYKVRYRDRASRRAESVRVRELIPCAIPELSGAQHPLVARLVRADRHGTRQEFLWRVVDGYLMRSVEGPDNVPLATERLEKSVAHGNDDFRDYPLAEPLGRFTNNCWGVLSCVPIEVVDTWGKRLSSDRDKAVAAASLTASRLKSIDGVLYRPAPAPAWGIEIPNDHDSSCLVESRPTPILPDLDPILLATVAIDPRLPIDEISAEFNEAHGVAARLAPDGEIEILDPQAPFGSFDLLNARRAALWCANAIVDSRALDILPRAEMLLARLRCLAEVADLAEGTPAMATLETGLVEEYYSIVRQADSLRDWPGMDKFPARPIVGYLCSHAAAMYLLERRRDEEDIVLADLGMRPA